MNRLTLVIQVLISPNFMHLVGGMFLQVATTLEIVKLPEKSGKLQLASLFWC